MTQESNSTTPFAASRSTSHKQALAVFALALFYVAHNVGGVFYQTRGIAPEQTGGGFLGYFAGMFMGALLLGLLERRRAGGLAAGIGGSRPRAVFFCALLLPSLFCQISFQITGYAGTPFLNFFQPALWAMHLPVALAFFFRHVRPGGQALFFGAAVSAGHVCWALLMPLAGGASDADALAGMILEKRYLPLLNLTRNLTGAAFAALCWQMARPEPAQAHWRVFSGPSPSLPAPSVRSSAAGPPFFPLPGAFPARQFVLLLLPFLACAFFNGFAGSLFFPRLIGRGMYPEYMHLALALLFPLAGLVIAREGDAALARLIGAATLCFAVFPLPLFLPGSGAAAQSAAHLVCAAMQQVLLFCGALSFSRFAPFSRVPALVFCAAWLAASAAIPGGMLASAVLPALSVPVFSLACLLAGLCAASLIPLRRAFPLPAVPAVPEPERAIPAKTPPGEAAKPEAPRPEAEAKLAEFAAAFALTARETEITRGILDGLDNEAMALALGVTSHTVRYHLGGLLKKTGMLNRRRFLHFYASWRK